MRKFLTLKRSWILLLYILSILLCVGLGMGVPFFCILLGLPVGVYLAGRFTVQSLPIRQVLGKALQWAALTSAFTFIIMLILWAPALSRLAGPAEGLVNFGIPLILYEPLASFIGWEVLMIFISPSLQFLMTVLGVYLTVWRFLPKAGG